MLQTNTSSDIRRQITPFGGWPPDKQTFRVGWTAARLTFEQITDALRPKIVKDLLYFRKLARQHVPDLLQQGWLRLWQALHQDSSLLARLTCQKAADYVTNRTGATTFRDTLKHYDSYHALSRWSDTDADVYEESITEIVVSSSLKSTGDPGHALFTRMADKLIDIEAALRQVAAWCMDDIRKLAALYYLTTSVSQVDAGRIAGFPVVKHDDSRLRCSKMQYWTRVVLKRLREAFASYKPFESNRNAWREQLKAGDTEPVLQLAQRYENEPDKLLALYALTTRVSRDTLVKECGVNESVLWYAMKQLRQELRRLYARRVPG